MVVVFLWCLQKVAKLASLIKVVVVVFIVVLFSSLRIMMVSCWCSGLRLVGWLYSW